MYPNIRLRRNRKTSWLRNILAETDLSPKNFILPVFVIEGSDFKEEIATMPGVYRITIDQLVLLAQKAAALGILAIAIFPVIDKSKKTENADEAFNPNNLACRAVKAIKEACLNKIGIICDVALDPYSSHGHDGIVINDKVDNDLTLEALCKQALILARAGVDIIAPSDMMDGRVQAIRKTLDTGGFQDINILSYAAKYASSFYAPFRGALNNVNLEIDKSTYQMDIRNSKEALTEIEQDLNEGADFVMIKPALPFLDIIYAAKNHFDCSIFAYQVSGEYAMLKYASLQGALNFEEILLETLTSIKRAGACAILTYGAIEAAQILINQVKQ